MSKPVLIVQLRPEDDASDSEYAAFLRTGHLTAADTRRIRLDQGPLPEIDLSATAAVIMGGGPGCVSDEPATKAPLEARMEDDARRLLREIIARDHPFLGCCAGIGLLADTLGAEVSKARYGEAVSAVTLTRVTDDPLLDGLPAAFNGFTGHKEALQALPDDTAHLLTSAPCPVQMIRHKRNIYATQFHPEADAREFETRIHIYGDKGYFDPTESAALIDMVHAADVRHAPRIVENFTARYHAKG